jgi:hypothetical protein
MKEKATLIIYQSGHDTRVRLLLFTFYSSRERVADTQEKKGGKKKGKR